jgi:energy-coupling factor transporter ATP-binding protein EcfA2
MRVKSIALSWFRGAANDATLELDGKSLVVYGPNGSGKSSFVDAVEYLLRDGKIDHLGHEYSGRYLQYAVPNTHAREGAQPSVTVRFSDDSAITCTVTPNGQRQDSGDMRAAAGWQYERSVLRQGDLDRFINAPKGEKYSSLLPLLGLTSLEYAAENLRQLKKAIAHASKLDDERKACVDLAMSREARFPNLDDSAIVARMHKLHVHYADDASTCEGPLPCCDTILSILASIQENLVSIQARHAALSAISTCAIRERAAQVHAAAHALAQFVEPFLNEKLEIIQATRSFTSRLDTSGIVPCPACDRAIQVSELQAHVDASHLRLESSLAALRTWQNALASFADAVRVVQAELSRPELELWRGSPGMVALTRVLEFLQSIDPNRLRTDCGAEDLAAIDHAAEKLLAVVRTAISRPPPRAAQIVRDREEIQAGRAILAGLARQASLQVVEKTLLAIQALESQTRDRLREQAERVIGEISDDARSMWEILHPGDPIRALQLYVPSGVDKAIDISLSFHGVPQNSPRLTLSEGYRNSLGLCVFLAMAIRDSGAGFPIVLDDIVSSLDRQHRGMIAKLLVQKLGSRQVVLFTHDRKWFVELRKMLPQADWRFVAFRRFKSPAVGIALTTGRTSFAAPSPDEASDAAANRVRKVMDEEMPSIAEALRSRLQFLQHESNDTRTSHEFLARIASDAKRAFRRRVGNELVPYVEAVGVLRRADTLLHVAGNEGSHSFDVEPTEAADLATTCESALKVFECAECGEHVWASHREDVEVLQCRCGSLEWHYGKT